MGRDANMVLCEDCNCNVQRGSWHEHVNGRKHRQNAARHGSSHPAPPSGGGGGGGRAHSHMSGVSVPSAYSSGGYTDSDENDNDYDGSGMQNHKMCPTCTLMNRVDSPKCQMCQANLRGVDVIHLAPGTHLGQKQTVWHCRNCEHTNPLDAPTCCVCGFAEGETTAKRGRDYIDVDKDDGPMCVVCMAAPQSHVILPCKHTCLCGTCAVRIEIGSPCILCRVTVQAVAVASGPLAPAPKKKGIVAPVLHDDGRRYAPAGFPWIGGEVGRWDYFLEEATNATMAFAQKELSGALHLGKVTLDRCKQSDACLRRFKEGWKQLACPEGSWAGLCGWHCNKSYSQMGSLAINGWDSTRRKRTLHGAGEYFGMHHSQVVEYAGENHQWVLIAFVLRGSHVSMVEDYCYIVDNPASDKIERDNITFCLPVALAKFTAPPMKWGVPRHPYRWQFGWQSDEDEDQYINFEPEISKTLSKSLTLFFSTRDPRYKTATVGLDHHDGRGHVKYIIDVGSYTQRNTSTEFVRKINCTAMPATRLPRTLWMLLHDRDYWIVLDFFAQREMTEHYMAYHHPDPSTTTATRSGVRKPYHLRSVTVQIHSVPHLLDLDEMTITNTANNVKHAVAIVDA